GSFARPVGKSESPHLLFVQPQANLRSNEKRGWGRMPEDRFITIGRLAERTGVAVSAIRFYEEKGLLQALRTRGNQRRFLRSDIRRVSFILIAQKLGLALVEIEAQLANLPQGRAPTLSDWQQISRRMRFEIDARINLLTRT